MLLLFLLSVFNNDSMQPCRKQKRSTQKMWVIYNIEKSIGKMKYDLKQCQCYSLMLCNHEDFNVESGFHFVSFFSVHYMNPFCLWLL